MGRFPTVAAIVLVLLLSASSESHLEAVEESMDGLSIPSVPIVTILAEHGTVIDANVTIEGRVIAINGIEDVVWTLIDGNGTLANGSLMGTVETVPGTVSTFSWSLPFDPTDHSPCSCLLLIEARDPSGLVGRSTLSLFAGPADGLAPSIVLPMDPPLQSAGVALDLDVVLTVPTGNATVEWIVATGIVPIEVCGDDGLSIATPEGAWNSTTADALNGTLGLDPSTWPDGWSAVHARASDDDGRQSWTACSVVGIDSSPPSVVLEGVDMWIESDGLATFDGSASTDPFWGRDGLVHVWGIERVDGEGEVSTYAGTDLDQHGFSLSESGVHRITLTVTDRVGNSNTTSMEVTVVNAPPIAAFSIDGVPAIDGEVLRLADSDSWSIDASASNDTANDEDELHFLWSLDGEDVMTGRVRDLARPDDDGKRHELTLTVTDDDGAKDSLAISIGIAGTASDPARSVDSPLIAIAVVLFALIAAAVAMLVTGRWPNRSGIQSWERRDRPPGSH